MYSSANRTATTSLSLALLLLAALPAGCIADTTRSPESTDTGLQSDIQRDTPDAANDPDQDGIPSSADLCPETYDPRQKDWDKDGAGDACDPTIDLNESNALVMRDLPVQRYSEIQIEAIGDFNGDEQDEFAIGVPDMDEGRGRILLYSWESLDQEAGTISVDQATGVLKGEFEDDLVGCKLQGVGDVNGDGFADFSTLQCQRINRQGVHLMLGQDSLRINGKINELSTMKFAISRKSELPYANLLRLEDVNNDGMDDFAITSSAWPRVIRVVPGSTSFPEDVGQGDHHFLDEWKNAASTIELQEPADDSPIQFAPLGDLDDNGIVEFGFVDALDSNGPSVDVHLLSADIFPTVIGDSVPVESLAESSEFPGGSNSSSPKFVPLGDVDGDGLSDFAFSPSSSASTKIFFGSNSRTDVATLNNHDNEILHPSRIRVIAGMDMNSDGFSDLVFSQGQDLMVLSGNRDWKNEITVKKPDEFDLVISVGGESTFRSQKLVRLPRNTGNEPTRLALVLEPTDHEHDSGTIIILTAELPLATR